MSKIIVSRKFLSSIPVQWKWGKVMQIEEKIILAAFTITFVFKTIKILRIASFF